MQVDVEPGGRARALGEALERGGDAELVERGGPQIGDQAAQALDALGQPGDRLVDHGRQVVALAAPARREQDLQAGEVLEALVVELARPPRTLVLGRLDAAGERARRDPLRGDDGGRGARREGLQQPFLAGGEPAVAVHAVERGEDADRVLPVAQRHEQAGGRTDLPGECATQARGLSREPLVAVAAARRRGAEARSSSASRRPSSPAPAAPATALTTSSSPSTQRDHHDPRLDERAAALGDELEHPAQVRLGAERAGDRHRRLERGDGALELVAAVELAAVEVGVVDRDRRPVGEHEQGLLVLVRERAGVLLREVEVAPGGPADEDRDAEERRHRRVVRRIPVRARVVADVVEPQRRAGG